MDNEAYVEENAQKNDEFVFTVAGSFREKEGETGDFEICDHGRDEKTYETSHYYSIDYETSH